MGKEKKTSVSKKAIAVPNPSANAVLISQVVAESVKAAMAAPEKPKKELSEADLFMLKNCPIDKYILELPHNLFDFHFEDEVMFITLKEALENRLNNEGIVYHYAEKYSYIDLLLNPEWDGSFNKLAGQAAELYPKTYDETKENDQFSLLSFIMLKYFQYKFGKIDRLEDVDRPIPYSLFVKIVNKQKNLKVMCLDKDGNEVAGYLKKVIIQRTDDGIRILAELKIVSRGKEGFVDGQVYCQLPSSNMMKTIEDLGITILTPEMEEKYKARGAKYVKYNENPAYCYFKGFAYRRGGWFGDIRLNIASRIMTDINAFRLLNSNIDDSWYIGNPFNNGKKPIVDFSENDYWRCAPIVYGFAFGTKDWIRMNVEHISDIVFSENAFEELIIPEKYKEVFLACLSNDIPSLDSIDGKGSGKIFLLYGPPGVGK